MSSSYQKAKSQGYSDEDIIQHFSKKDPSFTEKYQRALQQGYQPEEIFNHLQKPEEKSLLQKGSEASENFNRQALRTGSRIAENVIGAPRQFGEFLESIVPEKALIKGAEQIGLGEGAKNLLETTKKISPFKLLPRPEDVRQVTDFLFGEKNKPKNEWEEKADTLVTDFTNLAIPIGNKFKVLKPALTALGGNVASEVIGRMGGTENEKTFGKLAAFFLGSMVNPKSAENLKNTLYDNAKKARPADAKVTAINLKKKITSLLDRFKEGDPKAASKTKATQLAKTINSKIKKSEITIDELEQFKRDINEARGSLYGDVNLDKIGKKTAKRNLNDVSGIVDSALNEYGKTNPEWEAFYRPANEVHGAIAESKKTRNFLINQGKKYGHHLILPLLGVTHAVGPAKTLGGAVAGGALGAGALGIGELIAKAWKSPTIRKLYMKLLESGSKQNALATKENMDKLEKKLKEQKSIQ